MRSITHHDARPLPRRLWLPLALAGLLLAALGSTMTGAAPPGRPPATAALPRPAAFFTTTITLPTYPYADHVFEAYDAAHHITYPVLNWDSYLAANPTPQPQTYELLVLANDYLTVTLLPALGGRIYQLIDRATGHNHLYQNPVIKPTRWGPPQQGWWLAVGGVEWCLPVDEHGYEWGVPWAWEAVSSTAGITVTLRDSLAPDRLRATIDLFLPAERALLALTPHLENPTSAPLAYKFWINAALAPGAGNQPTAGLRFVFNASEMAVHSTGDDRLPGAAPIFPTAPDYRFGWPVHDGVDFSQLGHWDEWLGFFEYPQAAADFAGVYSHDAGAGVARVFPRHLARGTKGFGYGWAHPLDWHLWTDEPSGGVELHGGVAPTFWDTATLAAGAVFSWTEVWYPLGALGGLAAATAEAALHVQVHEDGLEVGVHSTLARPGAAEGAHALAVWERATCALLDRHTLPALAPAAPHRAKLATGGRPLEQLSVAYVDAEGRVLAAVHPAGCTPHPRLAVHPPARLLLAELGAPARPLTASFAVSNTGLGTLTWTAALSPTGPSSMAGTLARSRSLVLTPTFTLPITQGVPGDRVWVVANPQGLATGTYTTALAVSAFPSDTLDAPQSVTVTLKIVERRRRLYLPCVLRQ